jgi:hypothetical protein
VTPTCLKRLKRLKAIVSLYEEKREALAQVRAMREWIIRLEHILDGSWAESPEQISNAEVARRLDEWLKDLARFLQAEGRTQEEQLRLGHLLKVMSHLRPGLVQCYDLPGFPRTNNDMELSIRVLKMRYRRISGRKNWNAYLLRYGRCVAYYEWWMQQPNGPALLEARLRQTAPALWRSVRQQTRDRHREQLNCFRFRHHPQAYLTSLELRWEQTACT